jgi:hypothetical protein
VKPEFNVSPAAEAGELGRSASKETCMLRSVAFGLSILAATFAVTSARVFAQQENESVPIEKIDLGDLKDHFQIVKAWRGPQESTPPPFVGGLGGGGPFGLVVKLKCVKGIELSERRLRTGYFNDVNDLMGATKLAPPDFRMEPGEFVAIEFDEPPSVNGWKRCVIRETKIPK